MKLSFKTSALILSGCLLVPAAAFAHGHGPGKGHMFDKLDENGDGKITISEARTAAKARFSKIDGNGDQVVTLEEAKAHAKERMEKHRPTPEQAKARFEKADKNKNGKIERSESRMPEKWFNKVDANQDGALTEEELKKAFEAWKNGEGHEKAQAKHEAHLTRFFQKMDGNSDGKVTWSEALAASDARFKKMDKNGDQAVTQEEAREAHKGKRGHRAKGKSA